MMTFLEAQDEVEKIKDACLELQLDAPTAEFVLASYRHNSDLLRTILEHKGDHRCYVECKLIMRASLNDEPYPTFPPRGTD